VDAEHVDVWQRARRLGAEEPIFGGTASSWRGSRLRCRRGYQQVLPLAAAAVTLKDRSIRQRRRRGIERDHHQHLAESHLVDLRISRSCERPGADHHSGCAHKASHQHLAAVLPVD
jgi:hypothetical protein